MAHLHFAHSLSSMEVIYKKGIRRGHAKIEKDRVVLIIPFSAKKDLAFLAKMQELGVKLQEKMDKKNKNQIFSSEGVLLFGERVPHSELPSLTTLKARSAFFKGELFEYASPILQELAGKLGYHDPIPLMIRKVRSRRGSCSPTNRIMLSLSLAHLPTRLIQYVIIHEACHLVEKNHGPRFWALVEKYFPNFQSLRKELKNQVFL